MILTAVGLLLASCYPYPPGWHNYGAVAFYVPEPAYQEIKAKGTWVAPISRFLFPARHGELQRTGIHRYDDVGFDVGVHYADPGDTDGMQLGYSVFAVAKVETEPGVLETLSDKFERVCHDIRSIHGATDLGTPWTPRQTINQEVRPGRAMAFNFTVQPEDEEAFDVESRLYLYEYRGWFLKHRATYVSAKAELARSWVDSLVHWLDVGPATDR